jgi:hypothetical protein
MSYTINLTNGNLFAVIPDGTINQTSSQTLVGKNYAGYGQFLDDNFIHLLENGANSTPPGAPLTGQLWFNTTTGVLQVYNGVAFKSLGGSQASSTQPTNNSIGDLWYDTTNTQLFVWTGTKWLLVGPIYTAATGVTGAIPTVVSDTLGGTHIVVELYVNDDVVGIISDDTGGWIPSPSIPGFANVNPGIQLATTVKGQTPLFVGTATNATSLNGVTANAFIRTTGGNMTGALSVGTTSGNLTLGPNADFVANISGTAVNLINTDNNGNINFVINKAGITTTAMTINGATGVISGAAIDANYADVAERFAADEIYAPGTVVELGGTAEITIANTELSETVFGVISTKAAYLMNSKAGTDLTHPPIAMTGRVPVLVVGQVNKGDRLVSAGNGMARAAQPGEATSFNVIGRALESKTTTEQGTVEAIVTVK